MSKSLYLICAIIAMFVGTVFNYSMVVSTGSGSRSYGSGVSSGSGSSSGWHK